MDFNPSIFKTGDIRGIYGHDFDEAFAFQLGAKVATFFNRGKIIIGRDGRASSDPLARSVVDGAKSAGATVIAIGQCSTPLFYFAVDEAQASGGIMVTASHNQAEYNGFKVVGEGAELITGAEIEARFTNSETLLKSGGLVATFDPLPDYIDKVAEVSQVNFPIPPLDGIKIIFDNDHDRISFEEAKQVIVPEFIFLLLVEKCGFKKVVYDLRYSRVVAEKLAEWGVEGIKSKVGRTNVYRLMCETESDFGGELSGHYYFKSFNNLEAPELVLAYVAKSVTTSGQTLQELTAGYKKYFKSEEINIAVTEAPNNKLQQATEGECSAQGQQVGVITNKFKILKQKYSDAKIEEVDGLTVNYPDWWFNVRASNTEPELRLVVEAETQELLDTKLAEIQEILRPTS